MCGCPRGGGASLSGHRTPRRSETGVEGLLRIPGRTTSTGENTRQKQVMNNAIPAEVLSGLVPWVTYLVTTTAVIFSWIMTLRAQGESKS